MNDAAGPDTGDALGAGDVTGAGDALGTSDVVGTDSATDGVQDAPATTPVVSGVPVFGWVCFGVAAGVFVLAMLVGATVTGESWAYRALGYGVPLLFGALFFIPFGIASLVIGSRGHGRPAVILVIANLVAILAQLVIVASLFS